MKKLCVFVLMLLVVATTMFAQEKPTVVIVPFDAKDVNQSEVDVISDVFLSEYVSTGKAIVVDRGSFDKIKEEHQFQLSEWSDTTKVVQLGKALNAHQIITGQISKFGNQVVCTIKLIDVNTTEIISSSVKRVASVELLFDECIALSREIAIKAKITGVYDIGDKGPGGGIVFYIEGKKAYEVSEILGEAKWETAKKLCKDFRGGGYDDWYLPTKDELNLVYENLRKTGIISGNSYYWSSSEHNNRNVAWLLNFSDGGQYTNRKSDTFPVRAIRAFSN